MEYASLRGSLDGMDPTVISEIAEYYEKKYVDKVYYYFICPNCMRFSSIFLDRFLKKYTLIVIFPRDMYLFDFFCKNNS